MKTYLTCIYLGLFVYMQAQINMQHYTDYGFNKAVKEATQVTYSFEDKFAEETFKETYKFNNNGFIIEKTLEIYSGYGSDTKTTYEYDGDKLISESKIVKQYPNFNSTTNYVYDEKGNVSSFKIEGIYGSEFKNYYNKKNQLIEQHGFFQNSSSIEKMYYSKDKLVKTVKTYYQADTVSYTESSLFQNGDLKVFQAYDNLDVFIKTKNGTQKIRFTSTNNDLGEKFLEIENFLKTNSENKTFNELITNYSNSKIINISTYKYNSNQDWIACKYVDKEIFDVSQYKFQEIKYMDGSVSGSIDFNIFDVNELNYKEEE